MLKVTILLQVLAIDKLLSSRVFAINKISNIKGGGGLKFVKPKIEKLKSQKLFKFKKVSKCENSPKFSAKKIGSSFLIPNIRIFFNRLWLVFIKNLIF